MYSLNYTTPEEFVIAECSKNKGTQNNVMLRVLLAEADALKIEVSKSVTKKELIKLIIEKIGAKAFAEKYKVGVSSYHWQQKFGITNEQLRKLARKGFIQVTGKERFRIYGQTRYANLYDAFQFFELSIEDVQKLLSDSKRK